MEKKVSNFKEGFGFLVYGLEAFGVIGIELLWGGLIEPMLYQRQMNEFTTLQHICHWIVICIVWGLGAYAIVKQCKKESGMDLIENIRKIPFLGGEERIKIWQWILIAAGTVFCLISTWIDWNGSKVLAEFRSRGPVLFPFQYIYYLFEVLLVLLIIIFGQTAFEKWFRNNKIPFGGILVALTWGLAHWASKGTLGTALYAAAGGFVFGSIYLLTNRNVKLSYVLLGIMFIL
ncbi:MAG: hypothetical protein J5898_07840 [Lachnospiraceae bacterium]|nr:hypothetical protein [Lachnospiraceae bacterium]